MGHGIILSFFEIKKASLQMPFALVIDDFMAQKTPHRCDVAWSQEHIVSLRYLL